MLRRFLNWAKAHLKWTVSKWKSVLWSDESKFDILVGNHGRRVLRAKEEGDLPACHQRSVQKPASLKVWGCISAYGMGSLHVLEGTMNAERYIKVLEQHMLPSRWHVFQQDNAKPHTAALQQHGFIVEESGCWIGLQVRSFTYREHLEHHYTKNMSKMTTNSSAAGNLYQARIGPNANTRTQKLITSMPRRLQTVLKRRGDATPW